MTTLPRTGLSGDDEVSAGLLSSTALKDESSFKKLSPTLIEKYNTSLTLNGPTSPSASSPASSSEKLPQQQQINSEKSSSPSFSHPPLITSTYAEGSGALSTFSPPPQTSSLSINNAEINNSGELLSPVATRQQLAKSASSLLSPLSPLSPADSRRKSESTAGLSPLLFYTDTDGRPTSPLDMPIDAKQARRISKSIDKSLAKEAAARRANSSKIKLLLLGPGDSGKTTTLKQMRLLLSTGFGKEEKSCYLTIISANCIDNMRILVKQASLFGYKIHNELESLAALLLATPDISSNASTAIPTSPTSSPQQPPSPGGVGISPSSSTSKFTSYLPPPRTLPADVARAIKYLWRDKGIRAAYARANEFTFQETAPHFFERVERYSSADYVPNNEEILMCRQTTNTFSETEFTVSDSKFIVIDVGGQVAFRRAWAAFFDDAKAIIFVCSLAGYDQFMVEDKGKNRMRDALETFRDVCGNALLQHVSVILLLNKMDLAERKFAALSKNETVNAMRRIFPEFAVEKQEKEDVSFKALKKFFQIRFEMCNKNKQRDVYTYFTTSTDTKLMKIVIETSL